MKLDRTNKMLTGLGIVAAILIVKLFIIQVVDDKYKIDASNNSMVYTTIYPTRGIIHDRNGKILVGNKMAYDLLVTPREVEEFDTLTFCSIGSDEGVCGREDAGIQEKQAQDRISVSSHAQTASS